MKNVSNSRWSKMITRLLVPVTFMLVLLVCFSTAAQAADKVKSNPVEVKYVGSVNGNPIVQIDLEHESAEEVYLYVKDEYGNTIYTDVVKDKKYSRKLQFESEDLSSLKLMLTIRSKKGALIQAFEINKNTRTVEDVQIARL